MLLPTHMRTFSPRCCTPNKFSLPCRKHSLMCLYFHSNSRLLSSASTSHVYESVHLPRGLRTSPVPPPPPPPPPTPFTHTPTLLPASFNRHFLKCQLPTGPKRQAVRNTGSSPTFFQHVNSPITTQRTHNREPTGWLVT